MTSLTGTQIANTYKQLLQVGTGNVGLTSSLQTVQDGDANNSPLQLSNSTVNINGVFLLNGSALTATFSKLTGGTGIILTENGTSVSTVAVSGTINLNPNQSFGIVSATNIDTDELLIAGVSAANVTEVAAVSVLTKTNLDAITSINAIIGDGSGFATDAELAAVSATLATSINNSNTRITSVSDFAVALSATLATSIGNSNTNITTNTNAITSINSVIGDGSGFATDAELAAVSATMATSIDNSNTRITSVSDYAVALSATMATSIATRLPLAGGTLTGIVSGTDFYVSAVAIGVDTLLGKQLHIGTAAVADIVSLTDGATISVDFNTGQNFAVQLGGNRTLDNPTNCVPGQTGSAFIIQDGTGGRTLSYGANWEFAAGTAPTLSTAAAAVDRLDYIVYTSAGVHAIATLDVK